MIKIRGIVTHLEFIYDKKDLKVKLIKPFTYLLKIYKIIKELIKLLKLTEGNDILLKNELSKLFLHK